MKEELEIRGIHRTDILAYLIQLNGHYKQEDQSVIVGNNWECFVSQESYMRMFHSDIPIVFVTFTSNSEKVLKEVIRQFRLKTFRAGG